MPLLVLFLLLAACGFRPVHAPISQPNEAALQYVMLEEVPSRSGQILQTELEDILHPSGQYPAPRYRLALTLTEEKQPIVIERNGRVSRYNLLLKAEYRLTDFVSGAPLHQGKVRRNSSFNASLSDFSTYVSESDARNRGVKQIAQDIAMRLAAQLKPM